MLVAPRAEEEIVARRWLVGPLRRLLGIRWSQRVVEGGVLLLFLTTARLSAGQSLDATLHRRLP